MLYTYNICLNYLLGFLLELLNCSLVNPTTFVDEMTCGRRLARVDMTNHHDVDMKFFGSHFGYSPCKIHAIVSTSGFTENIFKQHIMLGVKNGKNLVGKSLQCLEVVAN